jgi:hypothetical protein
MTRPRAPRPTLTAAEALAATKHIILGPESHGPRARPLAVVIPIEYLPTPRPRADGLAGVTDAYLRDWRSRLRAGRRERRTRGGAA